MKTSLNRIYTSDGIELVGLLFEPDAGSKTVLVHVHGMAGNFYENKFIDFLAETLTKNGVAFFTFNNRGCEYTKDLKKIKNSKQSFVRIGDAYEMFDDSSLDIKSAVDFVSKKEFSKIHLSGHSLGASKVAFYSAKKKDERLASVIFMSPSDMVGLTMADKNYQRDVTMARKMIKEKRGRELLPFPILWDSSFLSARTFISLGDKSSNVAIFNFYDKEDKLKTLSKITIPTMTVMGKKDAALTTSIDKTMDRIKKALVKSPKIETNILGDADHGYNNYGQQLAEIITRWIGSVN